MANIPDLSSGANKRMTISVDAMGGDRGPAAVVAGIARAARKNPKFEFLLFGPEPELRRLLRRRNRLGKKRMLVDCCGIRHVDEVVSMDDKPSHVLRNGKGTSMWAAVEAVRGGEADAVVSCGNTGALMALSTIRLKKLPGVDRPAIACLWPSRSPGGFNVLLDVGADIRADARNLLQYALMGASYARNGLELSRPRIGLMNVGTEENKGHTEIREAHDLIASAADDANFEFVGFVEGGDIPSGRVDVIVTDGFTGNIALKTGEGTALLIREFLREAFRATPLSRIAALLAVTSLRRLSKRIDPRRVNGGVFLGLNGTVVKSHGSADAVGVASAIGLACRLAESRFNERLAARVASVNPGGQCGNGGTAEAAGKERER
ncbi:MAG: phosphate acyltransferase PlsX [Boseongicola sp. SB0677_bin_26]|nr:phosphate acyltransferase PlsX [Boseongicola sp. SB0665_bin_10]MYG24597.1 phosphate acyltransferase PlsX [Boseongicola sp. SB0677_bin_26]